MREHAKDVGAHVYTLKIQLASNAEPAQGATVNIYF